MISLIHGDCLIEMKSIPDKSVDMVLCDPPYGTTACKWDVVIPFESMWNELRRIIKDNGAICLFGSEPFSSHLRLSNLKMFKYDWMWEKNRGGSFVQAKRQPMREHEVISVFYDGKEHYYPQMIERSESGKNRYKYKFGGLAQVENGRFGNEIKKVSKFQAENKDSNLRYPRTILKYNTEVGLHPSQKPVALLEYLIKTYTQENETVLDFAMGSGSTGVACKNLNRKFIGIEKDQNYFEIAQNRILKGVK